MAVAFDAFANAGEFTAATDPKTWTHTPVGTPRGVVVFIQQTGTASDFVNGTVSYGGVAMTRVPTNGFAVDSAIEVASIYAYFLGSGIPTGAQTVSIDHDTGIFGTKHAISVTLTASSDTEIVASGKLENDAANPSIALDSGARTAIKLFNLYSGRDALANITNTAGMTRIAASKYAAGNFCYVYGYRTTPGTGSETVVQTADSDDVAMIGIAVAEVAATTATAGTTSGTGLASSPSPRVRPAAGHASATGAAYQSPMPVYAQAGHATADGWASQGEGSELDVDPATIEATAAAGAASAAVAVPIGHASATGAAGAPTPGAGAPAGIASFNATAEAHDATVEVVAPTVIAEHATATGAASDATPGLSLPAEHLAATAEASGIGASVAVSPSVASATGAAQTATATVPGVAGTAMVQAAAQAPSTSVKASAGHASASASADAVVIAMAVYPAAASAIAAAYPLQAAVVASAGIAQATGATYDIRPPFDWGGVHVYLNPAPAPSAVLGPAPAPSAVMGDT